MLVGGMSVASAVSCTTSQQSKTGSVQVINFGQYDGYEHYAQQFTVGATGYTICKVTAPMTANGSPDGNITLSIYSDNGSDVPNESLGTSTTTYAASNLTGDPTTVTFEGLSVAVSATTKYFIVVIYSKYDASNYPRLVRANWDSGVSYIGDPANWMANTGYVAAYNIYGN